MDFWDTYELDASLRDHEAPAVGLAACVRAPPLESGEAEMGPLPEQLLEAVGAFPSTAVFTPSAGFSLQDHTAAGGNIINGLPDVWDGLDVIYHLIWSFSCFRRFIFLTESSHPMDWWTDQMPDSSSPASYTCHQLGSRRPPVHQQFTLLEYREHSFPQLGCGFPGDPHHILPSQQLSTCLFRVWTHYPRLHPEDSICPRHTVCDKP
ncbi:unnamed protein product [Timema podura]|uniref:Uncharacterized protein n=1 Tax=Timema podura TaxID=61482 RepID=A0ABN7PJ03_TIMPD|nr:unnamed protein product [Timema podura]